MSAALSWLGPWCWQYLSVYLYKGIWIQFCEIFCNYTFIIIYFQSCQKKKIIHNNRWIFQCLVYKHMIYESRFNLVCSNVSYKPLNLELFGPDIFFFYKESSCTVIFQKSISKIHCLYYSEFKVFTIVYWCMLTLVFYWYLDFSSDSNFLFCPNEFRH